MTESMNNSLALRGFNITARVLAVAVMDDGWQMTVLGKHLSFSCDLTGVKIYVGKKGSFRKGPNFAQSVPFLDRVKADWVTKGKVLMAEKGLK